MFIFKKKEFNSKGDNYLLLIFQRKETRRLNFSINLFENTNMITNFMRIFLKLHGIHCVFNIKKRFSKYKQHDKYNF